MLAIDRLDWRIRFKYFNLYVVLKYNGENAPISTAPNFWL
jgi:hypothetical protein